MTIDSATSLCRGGLLAGLLTFLIGCPPGATTPASKPTARPAVAGSAKLTLSTNASTYRLGKTIALTLTNRGAKPFIRDYPETSGCGRIYFDIHFIDSQGRTLRVTNPNDDVCDAIISAETLRIEPGQQRLLGQVNTNYPLWLEDANTGKQTSIPFVPGRYTVRVMVDGQPPAEAAIAIQPR